jgi:hypothetical protein
MLRSLQTLQNYTMGASDGDIGHVTDLYFDDQAWVVRYLVVQTGPWLTDRKVLISPFSVGVPDAAHERLPVRISREQVKNSPDIDTEQPVSRQHETQYSDYYGYPYYWGGDGMWGDGLYYPAMMVPRLAGSPKAQAVEAEVAAVYARAEAERLQDADPHLRSCTAVVGYHLQASDGDLGHVQGMLVDEETWAIRYLVVDTSNWWVGHQVLIAPQWITEINWAESKVHVNLTQQAIKDSPRFESSETLNRAHEADLYRYYDRPTYWEREQNRLRIEESNP